jgi:alcohol dehydrogenase
MNIIGSRAYLPEDIKACLDFVAKKELHPVVEKELKLEEAAEGVRMLEERRVFGKIIVNL